jgi:hypothetical protein
VSALEPWWEICPVCGLELKFEPWRGESPADDLCPSCGIQFGYDDAAGGRPEHRSQVYRQWREAWLRKGMPWASVAQGRPNGWDPKRQLKRIRQVP